MLNGKKILVVEDSRTIRQQIKMILEQEGVTVQEAANEWGMFTKIEEYGVVVDLVIMDLVLHNEDGLDLIAKIKASKKYCNIPLIILTEKVEIEAIMKAKELGVKSYLKKPINKDELIKRLNNILSGTS